MNLAFGPIVVFSIFGVATLVFSLINRKRFFIGLVASGSLLGLALALVLLGPNRVWTNSFLIPYVVILAIALALSNAFYLRKEGIEDLKERKQIIRNIYLAGLILMAVGIVGRIVHSDFTTGFIFGGMMMIVINVPQHLIVHNLEKRRSISPKSVS